MVDPSIVWATVRSDLPELVTKVEQLVVSRTQINPAESEQSGPETSSE